MNIRHAVVPVAGLGTRMLPITAAVAKEMLPLGRKPTLQYIVEELAIGGIQNLVLVSSEQKKSIAEYFAGNPSLENQLRDHGKLDALGSLWSQSPYASIDFQVAIQDQQYGLGHAVLCAAEQVLSGDSEPPSHFVVALGDCVLGLGGGSNVVERMISVANDRGADVVIAFETVPDEKVERFGIAKPASEPDADGVFTLADVVEKPPRESAPSNLAIAARYVLSTRIFELLKNQPAGKSGEIQLTDAIRQLIADGGNAFGVQLRGDEKRFDVGNLASYTEAFVQFALNDPELAAAVRSGLNSED